MRRFLAVSLLPYLLVFLALPAVTLLVDLLLHRAGLLWVGRWLGPLGTALLLSSFLYSLRRRTRIRHGSVAGFLRFHEVMGWLGALVLLVHGGIHLNAVIPWLAELELLVVVASGLTGKVLLGKARAGLARRRDQLLSEGLSPEEVEARLLGMALVTHSMAQWRSVHMPLTMVFAALVVVHVFITLLFW
jgi:hypothetical protein